MIIICYMMEEPRFMVKVPVMGWKAWLYGGGAWLYGSMVEEPEVYAGGASLFGGWAWLDGRRPLYLAEKHGNMVEELGSMVMVEEPWEMIRDPGFIVLVVIWQMSARYIL